MIKEFSNQFHARSLLIGILVITVFKFLASYYIPIQFIPAPHDDYLFYRLAESIANLKWLGVFDQTTLIKGFTYPFFLSLSIFFKVPLRLMEAFLICIAALYFVNSIRRFIPGLTISLLIYAAIIFNPLQYSLIDFRLLRDMIYFPLLLVVLAANFYIYQDAAKKSLVWSDHFIHPMILGFSLFFFWNTREEGIWVIPALLFFLIFLIIHYIREKSTRLLLTKISIAILAFGLLQVILVGLNTYKYRFVVVTILKDASFQRGYASLHRLDSPKLWYEDISKQDWNSLFLVSPAVAELRPFVEGEGYRFWAGITCDAMRSQGYSLDNSGCPDVMPPGNVQFALMDALFQIGYRKPAEISEYMSRVADEIDRACDEKKLACKTKPPFMLSRNIFEHGIPPAILLKNIVRSIIVMASPKPISISDFPAYFDLNMVPKMRKQLGAYLFEPQVSSGLWNPIQLNQSGVSQFFISSNIWLDKIFSITSQIYSWFIKISWIAFFPLFFVLLRSKSPIGILIASFIILASSRIGLMAILDYYAMAPISSLYLMSGTYALFIAEVIGVFYLLSYWIESRPRNSKLT